METHLHSCTRGGCVLTHGKLALLYILGVSHERLMGRWTLCRPVRAAALMYFNVLYSAGGQQGSEQGCKTVTRFGLGVKLSLGFTFTLSNWLSCISIIHLFCFWRGREKQIHSGPINFFLLSYSPSGFPSLYVFAFSLPLPAFIYSLPWYSTHQAV